MPFVAGNGEGVQNAFLFIKEIVQIFCFRRSRSVSREHSATPVLIFNNLFELYVEKDSNTLALRFRQNVFEQDLWINR